MSLDPSEQSLTLHLRVDGSDQPLVLTSETASDELDALLATHQAETVTVLPLFAPSDDPKKEAKRRSKIAKYRKKLGKGDWHEGELIREDGEPIPVGWRLDFRRFEARALAEDIGVKEFYWACAGVPLELHKVEDLTGDEEGDSIQRKAREGLKDMLLSALDWKYLGESSRAIGTGWPRLVLQTAIVLGISLALLALSTFGVLPLNEASVGAVSKAVRVITHPLCLPAILFGIYLRSLFVAPHTKDRREMTHDEARVKWRESAPHLLFVWCVLGLSVALLTIGKLSGEGELTFDEFIDESTRNTLIAIWVLTPLTYTRQLTSALGPWIEAAVSAIVSIVVLKFTAYFAGWFMALIWGLLANMIPFEFPEAAESIFGTVTDTIAELTFTTILIGYAWTKARENFRCFATVNLAAETTPQS